MTSPQRQHSRPDQTLTPSKQFEIAGQSGRKETDLVLGEIWGSIRVPNSFLTISPCRTNGSIRYNFSESPSERQTRVPSDPGPPPAGG